MQVTIGLKLVFFQYSLDRDLAEELGLSGLEYATSVNKSWINNTEKNAPLWYCRERQIANVFHESERLGTRFRFDRTANCCCKKIAAMIVSNFADG